MNCYLCGYQLRPDGATWYCEACGLIQYNGPNITYDNSYLRARGDTAKFKVANIMKVLSRVPPGSLLDYGCGEGLLVDTANALGWKATGFDPNFHEGTFCGSVDSTTMIDVIEHLDDPKAVLKELRPITKRLYILTPDAGGWMATLMGRRWFEIKPEHRFLYSSTTIKMLLEPAFTVWKIRRFGKVLPLRYIASILEKDKLWGARVVRLASKIYPWTIHLKAGYLWVEAY